MTKKDEFVPIIRLSENELIEIRNHSDLFPDIYILPPNIGIYFDCQLYLTLDGNRCFKSFNHMANFMFKYVNLRITRSSVLYSEDGKLDSFDSLRSIFGEEFSDDLLVIIFSRVEYGISWCCHETTKYPGVPWLRFTLYRHYRVTDCEIDNIGCGMVCSNNEVRVVGKDSVTENFLVPNHLWLGWSRLVVNCPSTCTKAMEEYTLKVETEKRKRKLYESLSHEERQHWYGKVPGKDVDKTEFINKIITFQPSALFLHDKENYIPENDFLNLTAKEESNKSLFNDLVATVFLHGANVVHHEIKFITSEGSNALHDLKVTRRCYFKKYEVILDSIDYELIVGTFCTDEYEKDQASLQFKNLKFINFIRVCRPPNVHVSDLQNSLGLTSTYSAMLGGERPRNSKLLEVVASFYKVPYGKFDFKTCTYVVKPSKKEMSCNADSFATFANNLYSAFTRNDIFSTTNNVIRRRCLLNPQIPLSFIWGSLHFYYECDSSGAVLGVKHVVSNVVISSYAIVYHPKDGSFLEGDPIFYVPEMHGI